MSTREHMLDRLQDFLEYKKEEGFQTLELSAETIAALKPSPAPKAPARAGAPGCKPPQSRAAPRPASSNPRRASGSTLEEIAAQVAACTACPLSDSRKKTVPGEGNANGPDILFIGEGPGADEDEQGRPFVGEAGHLLDKMITAGMGYPREEVFITNVVKCRPPGNRVPSPKEMNACLPYLRAQIAIIKPKVIVALGKTAVQGLLKQNVAITRFRGTWCEVEGIDLMPTYHPAYLLRSPDRKGEAWADLKAVLSKLGKQPPPKK